MNEKQNDELNALYDEFCKRLSELPEKEEKRNVLDNGSCRAQHIIDWFGKELKRINAKYEQ